MKRTSLTIAIISALALAASGSLYARGWGGGYGPGYGPGGMGPGGGRPCQMVGAFNPQFADSQLTFLKSDLGITAGQEPAWERFANAYREQAQSWQQHRQAMWTVRQSGTPMTATDRWQFRSNMRQQRIAALQAFDGALTEFYGALSPEQQTRAARWFASPNWSF
jgi:hypothetical protein